MNVNEKIKEHLEDVFKPYENTIGVNDLKEELLNNMNDKCRDLINNGKDEESAYKQTIDSLGDISEIIESISDKTNELREKVAWNLSMSPLAKAQLDSVHLKSGIFNYSNLVESDFHNSDLSDSTFVSSDLKNSNFENAVFVKNSKFKTCELSNCHF